MTITQNAPIPLMTSPLRKAHDTVFPLPPDFAPDLLRKAYGCFPSGVLALSGLGESGAPIGMAVSAFVPVSLDPPLVQICIQNSSTTWPVLRGMRRLGLSVLSEQHGPVARALASKSSNRFVDVDWEANEAGAVFIHGSTLRLETTIDSEATAGDHSVCLMRIWSIDSRPDVTPLVVHGSTFRNLQPKLAHGVG